MHFIRFAIISLVSLFLVVTALSLLIPSKVRISRTTNIHASREELRAQLTDFNKWKFWNPFFKDVNFSDSISSTDSNKKMVVRGTTITLNDKQDSIITATMERAGRKQVRNEWTILPPHNDSIAINWTMDFDLHWYPWEKFGSLFFERSYGPRMEYGLGTLKKNLHQHHSSQ